VGQIGLVRPIDPNSMIREDGVRFHARSGLEEATEARILQGFLEESNVNPILEVSRMIEVQRAYELGQSFMDKEDERIRGAIRALGK